MPCKLRGLDCFCLLVVFRPTTARSISIFQIQNRTLRACVFPLRKITVCLFQLWTSLIKHQEMGLFQTARSLKFLADGWDSGSLGRTFYQGSPGIGWISNLLSQRLFSSLTIKWSSSDSDVLIETGILLAAPTIWSTKNRTRFHFGVFRPGKDLWLWATARFNQERGFHGFTRSIPDGTEEQNDAVMPPERAHVSDKQKNRCVIMNGCFTGGDALRDFN